MTQIQDWAGNETYLKEFEDVWSDYRRNVAEGISRLAEIQLRNLYQQMSLIESHAEMRLSIVESRRDAKKLALTLQQGLLLRKYTNGAMNKRMSDVMGDEDYKKILQEYSDAEDQVTIAKGSSKAASTASAALSREISARLKG